MKTRALPHSTAHHATPWLLTVLLTLMAAPTQARSDEGEADGPAEALRSRSECRALFGGKRHHKRNKHRRERLLGSVESHAGNVVDVTHSGPWFRPYYMELSGVELVDAARVADEPEAYIEVSSDAEIDCAPGRYKLERDDSLGRGVRVLDMLDDMVLIEFKGDLAYMLADRATPPTFRMIWRSPWRIIKPRKIGSSKGGSARRSKKRSRSRRKRNARRRRKRRKRRRRKRRRRRRRR